MEKLSKIKAEIYDPFPSRLKQSSIIYGCEKHSQIPAQALAIIPSNI